MGEARHERGRAAGIDAGFSFASRRRLRVDNIEVVLWYVDHREELDKVERTAVDIDGVRAQYVLQRSLSDHHANRLRVRDI